MKTDRELIRCDEPGCWCVVAERRRDGTIILRTRHHGKFHVTVISPPEKEPLPPVDPPRTLATSSPE
jgi:hypothetical protein